MYPASRAAFVAELEQKSEFKIIHSLFQQPDADPKAIAEKIIEHTISEVDNEQGSHYYDTACSVVEIAQRTPPEHQDKLCEFVVALKQRSLKHPKTGEPLMDGSTRVWTELPSFGYTFGDRLQQISGLSKKTTEEFQQDENLEAFVAKLTGYPSDRTVDFAYHGQIIINDAFDLENAQVPPEFTVQTARLACWWFIFAAPTLWAKVQDPKDENWDLSRWNTYKEGLRSTQATMRNSEAKKSIEQAIAEMDKAQQG